MVSVSEKTVSEGRGDDASRQGDASRRPTAIIVDDHSVVRLGVRRFLEVHTAVNLIGESATGDGAIQIVFDRRPDLVFLDFRLPDMSGTEVLRRVLGINPETKVMVLTVECHRLLADQMIAAGAKGFVPKDALSEELIDATNKVLAGGTYVAKGLIGDSQLCRRRPREPMHFDLLQSFTQEEKNVFQCIADGFNHKQGSDTLQIPRQRYEMVIHKLLTKTGALTEPHLVRYVLDRP